MISQVQRFARIFGFLSMLLPAVGMAAVALERGSSGTVVAVSDGDTLTLDDGTVVRLVGLQAPKLPLGRKGFASWPLAAEARTALVRLAMGRRLTLSYGGRRTDRYGRALAHLHDGGGRWLQGEMLRAGMARVYTFPDNTALAAEMYALEREARAAGRGIWGHPFYDVRTPDEVADDIDSFQIVEGRVVAVAVVRGNAYVNFGDDWRSDFTIFVASRDRRRLEAQGLDLRGLAGRRVRVRGWVKAVNGPSIRVNHAEQIEVLQ